jgi:hypothetical protein
MFGILEVVGGLVKAGMHELHFADIFGKLTL